MSDTNFVTATVVITAPLERVWAALSDHREFGAWFGVTLDSPLATGHTSTGPFTDPSLADKTVSILVEAIEAPRRLVYAWHPQAHLADAASEPMTRVEFTLEADGDQTRVTVVESGFDHLSAARRDSARADHAHGWVAQMANLARYVAS
jgi:uncharacterized protein YndB with AHSA1/START domain